MHMDVQMPRAQGCARAAHLRFLVLVILVAGMARSHKGLFLAGYVIHHFQAKPGQAMYTFGCCHQMHFVDV